MVYLTNTLQKILRKTCFIYIMSQVSINSTLSNTKEIKFMDFCAGIGGGRLGLEQCGMKCLAFSEINKNSERTYRLFFGQEEKNFGDLMKIDSSLLPDFDLMIGGFPCQTFSVMGQRKGFDDDRGQIIYGLISILEAKYIKYFILENVKGLVNHDNSNTLKIILRDLDGAGYSVYWKVLNSLDYGVPQSRERVYLVGIRKDLDNNTFRFPTPIEHTQIEDYLIDDTELTLFEKETTFATFQKYLGNKYNQGRFTVESLLKNNFDVIDTRQSDLRIYKNKTPTLRTGRHGILYVKNGKFRKLRGVEALLLQGFPKELAIQTRQKVSEGDLLSQAGNAMTVNTIQAIGEALLESI